MHRNLSILANKGSFKSTQFYMGCSCFRGLFLTLLSIVTCGVIFVFMLAVVIIEKKKKFDEVSETVFIVSIVVCVLCGLLLIFAIYASIWGKRCAKGVLGAVFCVFVAILIAFAACIWGLRDEVMEWIGENYVEKDLYRIIPTIVQCCEGMQSWWVCLSTKPCSVKFKEFFDDFGNAVGAIAIVLAVLLVVGAVICFCVSCRK